MLAIRHALSATLRGLPNATSHFKTCRVPTAERMPQAFVSENVAERRLALPGAAVEFEMNHRDGKYFQKTIQPGTLRSTESTIDLVYGAKSSSDEVYLSWHADDSLWELPVAWIYANNCWGAAGFEGMQSDDFARPLTVRCFECHTTWFEHVPGTESTYRREEALLGVTCERCHGPGREHVEFHRVNPNAQAAKAIVYPGGLERERLIEVCTQCHSNAVNLKGPANSFRPGQKLEDYYGTVFPKYNESDRVANQIAPMRQSKCFQQSEMTCITCHDPHLTGQTSHGTTFKDTCLQCHEPVACTQRQKIPEAIADNCVDCHMRQYSKINVNFAQADDTFVPPLRRFNHRIQVDPIANDEVMMRWYQAAAGDEAAQQAEQLKTRLLEHWRLEAEKHAEAGRFVAAVSDMRESLCIDPHHEASRALVGQYAQQQKQLDALRARAHSMRATDIDQAIELLLKVLEIRPDDAAAHGRLGTLYAQKGERETALGYLSQVAELDPDDQYGLSMMGWLAYIDSQFEQAAEYYRRANDIEPYNSKINFLWGSCLARIGQPQEALKRLQTALASDPKNLDAMRELIQVHLQVNDVQSAAKTAEQAVRLTQHRSVRDLMMLAQCHVALSDQAIAAEVAMLAIQAAQGEAEVFKIRQWCQENAVTLPDSAQ
jgi:tetratricopeptide (TPR) repeat protein